VQQTVYGPIPSFRTIRAKNVRITGLIGGDLRQIKTGTVNHGAGTDSNHKKTRCINNRNA